MPYLLAFALLAGLPAVAQSGAQNNLANGGAAVQAQNSDAIPVLPTYKPTTSLAGEEDHIAREVRHALAMQPYYTRWDWLAFRVNGNTVELVGDARTVGLKRSAVNDVKHLKDVGQVIDHINQLPPSPMDDRIRNEVAGAIFSWGSLSRYSWPTGPSIHIVVNGGRVRLEGIVGTQQDKQAAGLRANQVTGVFAVTNDLRVVKGA
jgi:hyperosmotically inducible protein